MHGRHTWRVSEELTYTYPGTHLYQGHVLNTDDIDDVTFVCTVVCDDDEQRRSAQRTAGRIEIPSHPGLHPRMLGKSDRNYRPTSNVSLRLVCQQSLDLPANVAAYWIEVSGIEEVIDWLR